MIHKVWKKILVGLLALGIVCTVLPLSLGLTWFGAPATRQAEEVVTKLQAEDAVLSHSITGNADTGFQKETDAACDGGSHIRTKVAGATVTVNFHGTGIRFFTKKGSGAGMLTATVDNGEPVEVNEYIDSTTAQFKQKVFEKLNLSEENEDHTLVLTTSTDGKFYNFDYFEIIALEETTEGEMDQEPGENEATITYVEAESSEVTKTGTFTTSSSASSHGGSHIFTSNGGTVEYTFTGDAISVYTKTGPGAGIADIYIDNKKVAQDDQYAATQQFQVLAYTKVFDQTGTHTIRLVPSGEKNPSATGTSMNVDCFKVFQLHARNASVSTLSYSINGGQASPVPGFSQDQLTYSVQLPAGTTGQVQLTGTPVYTEAQVTADAVTLTDGQAQAQLTVTADGGATKTYTVDFAVKTPIKQMNLSTDFLAPIGTWSRASGHMLYFGEFDNNGTMMPVAFRVLRKGDGVGQSVQASNSLLLDANEVLKNMAFDADNVANEGQSTGMPCEFGGSDIDLWLNGEFYQNTFTQVEQGAIATTDLKASEENYRINELDAQWYREFDTPNRKVFMLSVWEAFTLYPADADNSDNSVERGKQSVFDVEYGDRYWLRSSDWYEPDFAGWVAWNGAIDVHYVLSSTEEGVSPALNLNTEAVLAVSALDLVKTGGVQAVNLAADNQEWKTTLLDAGKQVSVSSAVADGNTVTVSYTYQDTNTQSPTNQISVMITDKAYTAGNATVLYYGKLDTTLSASGAGTFTLPADLPEGAKIYVMAEHVGGEKLTDYASQPVELTLGQAPVVTVDTAVLEYVSGVAADADTTGVVNALVRVFNTAKADAQTLLNQAEAGGQVEQSQVDGAWLKLLDVLRYMKIRQGTRDDLTTLCGLADTLTDDNFQADGLAALEQVVAQGRAVLGQENASALRMDRAWRGILTAMEELEVKG